MENTKSQKKSYSTASSKSRARRKTKTDYYDYSLVAVIVLLTCFGLIMLYSTSSYMAQINYGSDMYFFKKQAIISVACIIMALIISRLNYRILNRFSTALYVAAHGFQYAKSIVLLRGIYVQRYQKILLSLKN